MRAARAVRSIERGNLSMPSRQGDGRVRVFLVPTLVTYDQIAAFGEQLGFPARGLPSSTPARRRHVANPTALDAGVRVASAPTCRRDPSGATKELLLRAEVQSPLDVLRSPTIVDAELFGKAGELGVIAPAAAPTYARRRRFARRPWRARRSGRAHRPHRATGRGRPRRGPLTAQPRRAPTNEALSSHDERETPLTCRVAKSIVVVPMARIRVAERTLQGRSLSSFGALACSPGQHLDHEDQPGRRELAKAGSPVVRW